RIGATAARADATGGPVVATGDPADVTGDPADATGDPPDATGAAAVTTVSRAAMHEGVSAAALPDTKKADGAESAPTPAQPICSRRPRPSTLRPSTLRPSTSRVGQRT